MFSHYHIYVDVYIICRQGGYFEDYRRLDFSPPTHFLVTPSGCLARQPVTHDNPPPNNCYHGYLVTCYHGFLLRHSTIDPVSVFMNKVMNPSAEEMWIVCEQRRWTDVIMCLRVVIYSVVNGNESRKAAQRIKMESLWWSSSRRITRGIKYFLPGVWT